MPFHGQPLSGASGNAAGRTRRSTHVNRHAQSRTSANWPVHSSQRDSRRDAVREISGFVSPNRPSLSRTPTSRTAGLWALGTVGLAAATVVTATVAWRGVSKRIGAAGIGPAGMHLRSTSARPPEVDEPVSVLIAVRHEPDPTIAAVRAALGQLGIGHLDIVVLDDGCPQETRTALRQEFGDDPRVRILAAAPLPKGWSPRAHRSHQLAVAARGRVLIFTEPSAPLGPHAAASVTALLRGDHLDLAVLDTGRPAPATDSSPNDGTQANDNARSNDGDRSNDNGRSAVDARAKHGARSKESARPDDSAHPKDGAHQSNGGGPDSARQRGDQQHDGQRHSGQQQSGRPHGTRPHSGRTHPGRFTVAVDADVYWRTGGYRSAADDPDPLALLRMVRRASGRVAVADGRRVIPPAQLIAPLPPAESTPEAHWDSLHNSRLSLGETARRVFAVFVGARS